MGSGRCDWAYALMRCERAVSGTGVSATDMKGAGEVGLAAESTAAADAATGVSPYSDSESDAIDTGRTLLGFKGPFEE